MPYAPSAARIWARPIKCVPDLLAQLLLFWPTGEQVSQQRDLRPLPSAAAAAAAAGQGTIRAHASGLGLGLGRSRWRLTAHELDLVHKRLEAPGLHHRKL